MGEGKRVAKGKTGGKKSPGTYAVRQGFLVFPKGFPLRKKTYAEHSSAMSGGFPVAP
jgi:hypothetical protein